MIQENAHRPATASGHDLDRVHVDLVNVRPFLAVHLDRDKVIVEQLRDLLILEALTFHHMAPVTCRVANRQEDRLIGLSCEIECFVTPGKPFDWIVLVLQQVGADRVGKAIHNRILVGVGEATYWLAAAEFDPTCGPPAHGNPWRVACVGQPLRG